MKFRTIIQVLLFTLAVFGSSIATAQSLSLQDAVALALKNNRELKSAALSTQASTEQIRIARSYTLPSVGIGGQYQHYFTRSAFFGFTQGGTSENGKIPYSRLGGRDQLAGTLYISHPVYDPASKAEIRKAHLSERGNKEREKLDATVIAAEVKSTYLTILLLRERLKLSEQSLLRNQKALGDAKALFAQGRTLRVDTLRAYTNVRNLEPEMIKIKYAIGVQFSYLENTIGDTSLADLVLTDSLAGLFGSFGLPDEELTYGSAKSNRPELKILALNQQLNDQEIEVAKAGRLPKAQLFGQYGIQTQTNQFNFLDAYYPSVTYAGVQVNVPLFSGHRNTARIKQARILRLQSDVELKNAEELLKTDVKRVVARVNEAFLRIRTTLSVQEAARLSYDIIQYRYQKGMVSRLELTDTELSLTNAQLNHLEALYDYLISRVELSRVVGEN